MSKTSINIDLIDNVDLSKEGSLVDVVTEMLTLANHPRPKDWIRFIHPDAFTSQDVSIQRFLINRGFRLILGDCTDTNTIDARYCLLDTGPISEWVRLFNSQIIPVLVSLSLPPAIN